MPRKKLLACLIAAAAAAALLAPGARAPAPEPRAPIASAAPLAKPMADERFSALPAREALGEPRGEAFAARSWAPPAPRRARSAAHARAVSAPPPAPAALAPPMPYRLAGEVMHGDETHLVLAKGDAVVMVREGDSLDGGYRVESIGRGSVALVYLPLGITQDLPLASTPGAAAQLRWEGPERVRKGEAFDVALKVTSRQVLSASPLELAFDAEVLELLHVRPGRFFGADAKHSYRVSAQGRVSVGAWGKGGVASDAELVVFTFKPLRPAIAAQLMLASLALEGPVGKPIRAERIDAYRTSILPVPIPL